MVGRHLRPVIKHEDGGAPVSLDDALYAALHASLAAGCPVFFQQHPNDGAHAFERPRQPFQKNSAHHDRKLSDVHVVLLGAPVKHQRTEQHVDQQRIVEEPPHEFARRAGTGRFRQGIVIRQGGEQRPPAVGLAGKRSGNGGGEHGRIIGEAQRDFPVRTKGDAGAVLRREVELVAVDAELAENLDQRGALDFGPGTIGQRMQTDVVFATAQAVKTIEPAGSVMPLENADPPPEMGQTNAGGQTGHARTDDGDVVMRSGIHTVNLTGATRGIRSRKINRLTS